VCRVLQVGLDKKCGGKVRWKSAVEGRKKSHTLYEYEQEMVEQYDVKRVENIIFTI
jgi:hypothetical protein